MKRTKLCAIAICFFSGALFQVQAQTKVFTTTSGELIFSWANVEFTDEYKLANPDAEVVGSPARFTAFFHLGQNVHIDFNNNFGIFTGLGIRNIGFISDERLMDENNVLQDYKIIRRSYNLGIPIAFKSGSFEDHFFFYGGAEFELQFAFKEKYWESDDRSGSKTKNNQWFGSQTETFIPSVFAGVQLPKGINLKFQYYLDDFLNNGFKNINDPISDLTRYKSTEMMFVSISWQFQSGFYKKKTSSAE